MTSENYMEVFQDAANELSSPDVGEALGELSPPRLPPPDAGHMWLRRARSPPWSTGSR